MLSVGADPRLSRAAQAGHGATEPTGLALEARIAISQPAEIRRVARGGVAIEDRYRTVHRGGDVDERSVLRDVDAGGTAEVGNRHAVCQGLQVGQLSVGRRLVVGIAFEDGHGAVLEAGHVDVLAVRAHPHSRRAVQSVHREQALHVALADHLPERQSPGERRIPFEHRDRVLARAGDVDVAAVRADRHLERPVEPVDGERALHLALHHRLDEAQGAEQGIAGEHRDRVVGFAGDVEIQPVRADRQAVGAGQPVDRQDALRGAVEHLAEIGQLGVGRVAAEDRHRPFARAGRVDELAPRVGARAVRVGNHDHLAGALQAGDRPEVARPTLPLLLDESEDPGGRSLRVAGPGDVAQLWREGVHHFHQVGVVRPAVAHCQQIGDRVAGDRVIGVVGLHHREIGLGLQPGLDARGVVALGRIEHPARREDARGVGEHAGRRRIVDRAVDGDGHRAGARAVERIAAHQIDLRRDVPAAGRRTGQARRRTAPVGDQVVDGEVVLDRRGHDVARSAVAHHDLEIERRAGGDVTGRGEDGLGDLEIGLERELRFDGGALVRRRRIDVAHRQGRRRGVADAAAGQGQGAGCAGRRGGDHDVDGVGHAAAGREVDVAAVSDVPAAARRAPADRAVRRAAAPADGGEVGIGQVAVGDRDPGRRGGADVGHHQGVGQRFAGHRGARRRRLGDHQVGFETHLVAVGAAVVVGVAWRHRAHPRGVRIERIGDAGGRRDARGVHQRARGASSHDGGRDVGDETLRRQGHRLREDERRAGGRRAIGAGRLGEHAQTILAAGRAVELLAGGSHREVESSRERHEVAVVEPVGLRPAGDAIEDRDLAVGRTGDVDEGAVRAHLDAACAGQTVDRRAAHAVALRFEIGEHAGRHVAAESHHRVVGESRDVERVTLRREGQSARAAEPVGRSGVDHGLHEGQGAGGQVARQDDHRVVELARDHDAASVGRDGHRACAVQTAHGHRAGLNVAVDHRGLPGERAGRRVPGEDHHGVARGRGDVDVPPVGGDRDSRGRHHAGHRSDAFPLDLDRSEDSGRGIAAEHLQRVLASAGDVDRRAVRRDRHARRALDAARAHAVA